DTDKTELIKLDGLYSDGVKRRLPNVADSLLEFSSEDPSIVEVDNTGKMVSIKIGETYINAKSRDISVKILARVHVSPEPPLNLKTNPTQTEIILTWDLSPNDPKWVTEYTVRRTERADGLYETVIAVLPKGSTTFADTTAVP